MLKTSPILASSANASPTGFCRGHAPALSPPPPGSPRAPSVRIPRTASSTASSPADAQRSPPTRGPRDTTTPPPPPPPPRPQPLPTAPAPAPSEAAPASGSEIADPEHASPAPGAASSKRPRANEQPPKMLPRRYEQCAVEDMVELIAHMLAELIATNDAIRISSGGLTRFHSRTPPGISVRDYLHRLARHATLTPPLLLAMVYYIDRLCALYQEFTINTLTVHRFLITAATVAAKGLSDSFWNNTTYARVGGVRVAELKLLELEFLYRVDWKIVPNPEVLVAYYRGLVERTPGYALDTDGLSEDDMDDDDEKPVGLSDG
ncbi:cyclin domain-containing protein [Hirsutella rhossiliensis]|uniref:Cyclin domain-containing protein n=1 Tax=Hirsutella rhossiliensis TaxID=111463 RepID=A0A9P8SKJ9_9HYPO|nr:cyclin domain-containing protein [Hirsutella rhossiliensis]KAH0966468.1 cyclin domain-containing protein [Hirsutella rhossiliensis]